MFTGVIFAAFVIFAQTGPPVVTPPQPPPVNVTNHIEVTAPPPDPAAIGQASVVSFQALIIQLGAPTLAKWVDDLLNVPDFWRTTPSAWTYDNPAIKQMAETLRTVAIGLFALAVFGAGVARLLGHRNPEGRLFYGLILSVGNLAFWQIGISLNNAICDAIAAPPIADIAKPHLQLPALTSDPVAAFGPAVLVIVYAIVLLLLFLSLAFRLGLIDILIVAGSVLLLCKSTAQTDALASRYQALSIGTLFSQVMIVVALRLAPVLGLVGGGIVGTFLGITVLLLARKMPSMFSAAQADRAGGGLIRLLVLRRFLPV